MVVPTSDGNSRIYVGRRKYAKRTLRDSAERIERFGPVGGSYRGGGGPSPDGLENPKNWSPRIWKRYLDFYNWKNASYRKSDDLRWVAIGFIDTDKARGIAYGMPKLRERRTTDYITTNNSDVGLLGVGLMPSNIAKQHLRDLGFDIETGAMRKWYDDERERNGDLWHAQNEEIYDQLDDMHPENFAKWTAGDVRAALSKQGKNRHQSPTIWMRKTNSYFTKTNYLQKTRQYRQDSMKISS